MKRTTITIEDWQFDVLGILAERQGKSRSELIRDLLTERLDAERQNESLDDIAGIGASGRRASGRDHDEILYGRRKRR